MGSHKETNVTFMNSRNIYLYTKGLRKRDSAVTEALGRLYASP